VVNGRYHKDQLPAVNLKACDTNHSSQSNRQVEVKTAVLCRGRADELGQHLQIAKVVMDSGKADAPVKIVVSVYILTDQWIQQRPK